MYSALQKMPSICGFRFWHNFSSESAWLPLTVVDGSKKPLIHSNPSNGRAEDCSNLVFHKQYFSRPNLFSTLKL